MSDHLRVFFGHHKCATQWVVGILGQCCQEMGWRFAQRPAGVKGDALNAFVRHHALDVLALENSGFRDLEQLRFHRGFHLIRDPRDIVVSGYFSHLNSHPLGGMPRLTAHREKLRSLPQDEGLLLEMEFSQGRIRSLGRWDYHRADVLERHTEDFVADPYRGFLQVFEFLEMLAHDTDEKLELATVLQAIWNRGVRYFRLLPRWRMGGLAGERLLAQVYRHRFSRLAGGRNRGQEHQNSHYRKGVAGDWRSYFGPEHLQAFEDRFGNLPEQLGYSQ